MFTRKIASILTASVLTAALLAGCGTSSAAPSGGAGEAAAPAAEQAQSSVSSGTVINKTVHMGENEIEVEVVDIGKSGHFTYWSAFTGDSAAWDQKRIDAFNEAYADLGIVCDVQFVPDGAGINNGKLLSAIAGGTAPDLLITDNPTSAYQYVAEDSFLALDDILADIQLDTADFFDGCKDVMVYNGATYLVPQDTNVIMLYYNPDIAAECGLDPENPPTTLDELNAWSDAMTVQEADGSFSRFGIIPWLDSGDDAFVVPYIFGANPYIQAENKINLTDEQMLTYMNWIKDFSDKYDPERINAFTSGLGGMFSPDHPLQERSV